MYAYVASTNGVISIIDTSSQSVVDTIGVGSYPIGIAIMGGR